MLILCVTVNQQIWHAIIFGKLCAFSLIFIAPTYINNVDRALHRLGD